MPGSAWFSVDRRFNPDEELDAELVEPATPTTPLDLDPETDLAAGAAEPDASLGSFLERVALVAERNTPVRLTFSGEQVRVEAGQGEDAQASEQVAAVVEGGEITTGFNPQFLLDGLTAIEEPVVELAFTQAAKPAVITGVPDLDGERNTDFQYLLMPRRLLS